MRGDEEEDDMRARGMCLAGWSCGMTDGYGDDKQRVRQQNALLFSGASAVALLLTDPLITFNWSMDGVYVTL